MGEIHNGNIYCDWCGRQIFGAVIREETASNLIREWTFCSLIHREEKYTLVYGQRTKENVFSIEQARVEKSSGGVRRLVVQT